MIEVNIDSSEINRLADLLQQSPAVINAAKKEAIAAAAPKLKAIVDHAIGGSGKVRDWQGMYIGSKGLYAAVRPRKETWTERTKKKGNRYAVGYVTNASTAAIASRLQVCEKVTSRKSKVVPYQ